MEVRATENMAEVVTLEGSVSTEEKGSNTVFLRIKGINGIVRGLSVV